MVKVEIQPLEGKYYNTEIVVKDDSWDSSIIVEICGCANYKPSPREIANGWEPEDGMNHVEDEEAYRIACIIKSAIERYYNDI